MPVFFRTALLLALCLPAALARADSWRPPSRHAYTSADGATRLTVDPRPIEGALAYFRDKANEVAPAGQPAGAARATPMGLLEQRQSDGSWRTVWRQPLVNDVAPVEAVVANGGARVVTFDNWHSVGWGEDAVVIYDQAGLPLRKLSLAQLLPPHYTLFLPRSVSSLHWRKEATVSADGRMLELRVWAPHDPWTEEPPATVPVRVRLHDGQVQPLEGEDWPRAQARLAELLAQRELAWQQYRAQRAQPLSPPQGDDPEAWKAYFLELRERLSAADAQGYAGLVMLTRDARPPHTEAGLRHLLGRFPSERMLFASPDGRALAGVVADVLGRAEAGSHRDELIVLLATPQDFARVQAAAAHAGARLQRLDPATPLPGTSLPVAVPDDFIGLPPEDRSS